MFVDENDLSKLVSSASLVFFGGILQSLSKLLERILVARRLSPSVYGDVSIGIALLTFGVTLSLIGYNQGIPRFIARYNNDADVRGTWLTGLLIAGSLSLVLATVTVMNVELLANALVEEAASDRLLILFAMAIPFVVGFRVGIGGIRGLEKTIYRTYARDLFYSGSRLILLLILLSFGYGATAAGYAYVVSAAAAFVFAHVLLYKLVPLVGEFSTHAREMTKFSLPLVVSTVLAMLLTQTDTLMLGYFRSSYEVGLYGAAYPLANGMLIVLHSFGYLYLPLTSRLDADDRRSEIDSIYKLTSKWIFIVTFPAFLALTAFSSDILTIVFGAKYRDAGLALTILSVGFFTSAAAGRNRETLSAIGYTQYILGANAVAFFFNIAMNLVLIPHYGHVGAAVASASSYVALNITIYVILQSQFDISPFSRWSVRTFMVLPTVLFPPTYALSTVLDLTAATLVVFLVVAGLLAVYLVTFTGCLQPEDRVPLQLFEESLGVSVPLVDQYLPDDRDDRVP